MTDFELRSSENDEEKLEQLSRELEERENPNSVARVTRSSRTSARALFALGLIAGISGSSIMWFERHVDAYLMSIRPDSYPIISRDDVAEDSSTRLVVVIDEIVEAYEASLLLPVAPGSDSDSADDVRKLMSCALSARSALVTPEGAQTLVAPYAGCGNLLENISQYKVYSEQDVAVASVTALVSLNRGVFSDVLVATWDSERLMPTHRDLSSIMALATFVDRRDYSDSDLKCSGDAMCRFEAALDLARNVVSETGMTDLAQPLGDGAVPYRYAAAIWDFPNAGAYNMPVTTYAISTREGDTIVEQLPVVTFEYNGNVATPVVLGGDDIWNANISETELVVAGMKPVGWWPCNTGVVYSLYPKQGVWIEKYRSVPSACAQANYDTLDGVDPEADYSNMTTTVARQDAINKALALFER